MTAESPRRPTAPPALTGLTAVAGLCAGVWALWLLSLAAGGCWGAGPHAGCARVDFSAFWGAGRLADAGRAGDAYGWPLLRAELERAFAVRGVASLPFLYPPPMLLVAGALGAAPYGGAFAMWTAAGLAAYGAAAWAVLRRPQALVLACAPAGVFFCAFAGQTGLLEAAALAGALLVLERRPALAGVLFALFAGKPQLALLVPVALVAGRRWHALAAAAAAYALLWGLAAVAFGPQALSGFLHGAMGGGGAFTGTGWLPWWKVQSLYGALRAAGVAAGAALAGQTLATLAAAAGVWTVWRGGASASLRAAVLAAAALTASPYGFVYDGPLLAVATLFVLRDADAVRPLAGTETALLAAGLLGQAVFVVAPGPLVTPLCAVALLGVAALRIGRRRAPSAYAEPSPPLAAASAS